MAYNHLWQGSHGEAKDGHKEVDDAERNDGDGEGVEVLREEVKGGHVVRVGEVEADDDHGHGGHHQHGVGDHEDNLGRAQPHAWHVPAQTQT